MTHQEIEIIRDNFAHLGPRAEVLGSLFYQRLFHMQPSLRRLFTTDIVIQSKKLTDTLAVLMGSLDRLEALRPTLRLMGRKHVSYFVLPEHYDTVGQALLGTIGTMLGARFDEASRAAWTKLLSIVSTEMLAGAEMARAATV